MSLLAQALLSSAAMGSATAKSHILSLLDSMTSSPKRPKPRLIPTTSPASPTSPVPKRKPTQPPAPYPGATPVLSRPYPTTSGRRRVPKIVNGNGIPFLRFKKPQSPFLSRIIRDKIKQRTRRFDLMHALENSIQAAEDEDRWDDMIREEYGIGDGIGDGIGKERRSGPRWVDEVHNGKRIVKARITQQEVRFGEIGRRMQEIVEKEGELARVERGQRRKVRDRMRKMRKMEELEGVKDPQVPVVAVE
ncbi:MAG: hypothetical protein M1812_001849 [Candelaria pacifica]|nr:MAG: hypothetical protein M1812_001849 [Candelaria pacifica]